MKNIFRIGRIFHRDERGLAYLEFALSLPFLLLLFMGSVEVTRYIIIAQKVEKTSVTISDVISQSEEISEGQIDLLITAAGEVMQPYEFSSLGYVIITSATKTGSGNPTINWQYTGGGTWVQSSQVGSGVGAVAALPNGLTLNDKDTVIIAEVYYNYQPMLTPSVLPATQLYKVAVFKPRLGNLKTLGS